MGSSDAESVNAILTAGGKIVQDKAFAVTDAGVQIDLDGLLEDSRLTRAVYIANRGANNVFVAFDKDGADIDTTDNPKTTNPTCSWDTELEDSTSDFNLLSSNIECRKIAARCPSGQSSTIYILVG